MHKSKAIELLGGSIAAAAEAIGVSYQAVNQWPDELPVRISDRVLAVIARKNLPPELIGEEPLPVINAQAKPLATAKGAPQTPNESTATLSESEQPVLVLPSRKGG